ncbi:MAG: hypothetical protein NZL91_02505 [Thermoflexales bacterium]|nr:hypothetical protein [Thermoflexales bacterium]MDW8292073.1 hypothetical protein [Anaerolineae bacterium]
MSFLRSLFVVPPPNGAAGKTTRGTAALEPSGTPVFLTPQTLVTFPGATLAVKVVGLVVGSLVPSLANNNVVLFVASVVIGAFIAYNSWDPSWDARQRVGAILVGALNVLFIYAAAAGLLAQVALVTGE